VSRRLPVDYKRCKDGEACPFADICKRRLTISYDIMGEGHYLWDDFFARTTKNADGDVVCEHRIIAED
jgi:hypothetical protein